MVHIIATLKSKPGQAEPLRAILRKLTRASRAEPGVLRYDVLEIPDADEFVIVEQYADDASFEIHKSSRHVAVAFARAATVMDGELKVRSAEMLTSEET